MARPKKVLSPSEIRSKNAELKKLIAERTKEIKGYEKDLAAAQKETEKLAAWTTKRVDAAKSGIAKLESKLIAA